MTTLKLYITQTSDSEYIRYKQQQYAHAYMLLYQTLELASDKEFINQFTTRFDLNRWEYQSLVVNIKMTYEQDQTNIKNKQKRINKLTDELSSSNLSKHRKFKIIKSINHLNKSIKHIRTFGSLKLQQQLTREHNKSIKDFNKITKLTQQWKQARNYRPIYVVGEASQTGNRCFDFSCLTDGVIIYKPNRQHHITINVKVPQNQLHILKQLSDVAVAKLQSITVTLTDKYICLTYDEESLNGYGFDERGYNLEKKVIKSKNLSKETTSQLLKDCKRGFYEEQTSRKLQGKIPNRCFAVDLNPTNIGYSVLDKTTDGKVKIVATGMVDLSKLTRKSGKCSSHKYTKYLNNKRKYEITIVAKELMKLVQHYRCSSFIMEELDFAVDNNLTRGANRLTHNVWNRELLIQCIQRRCKEQGVDIIEVNACYSSFIGNIQNSYVDSTNASIEIGRRGLYRYTKGSFYPHISSMDIHTLEAKFGDVVEYSTTTNWVDIYQVLNNSLDYKEFALRLRPTLNMVQAPYSTFSLNSYKSGVILNIFNII